MFRGLRKKLILANVLTILLNVVFAAGLAAGFRMLTGTYIAMSEQAKLVAILIFLFFLLLLVVLTVMMSISVMRSLLGSIGALRRYVSDIQEGDLRPNGHYNDDEFAEVYEALALMGERLSESLEQREQAEHKRMETLTNISHDLKTPITSIQGYARGLLDGVADTPERREKYLRTICEKAEDLNRLTDSLLLYTKQEAGVIAPRTQRVPFADYVGEILDGFSQAEIVKDFRCNDSAAIDTDMFTRVINNILENSVKYCADPKIKATIWRREEAVILSLEDNGPGVAPEQLDKIFDRFYRTDGARTETGSGNGLGLSIARQIVESHGGRIWARLTPAGSLCLYISLEVIW